MTDEELNRIILSYIELSNELRESQLPLFVEKSKPENDRLFDELKSERRIKKRRAFFESCRNLIRREIEFK